MDKGNVSITLPKEIVIKVLEHMKKSAITRMDFFKSEGLTEKINQEWGFFAGMLGAYYGLKLITNEEMEAFNKEWQLYNPVKSEEADRIPIDTEYFNS